MARNSRTLRLRAIYKSVVEADSQLQTGPNIARAMGITAREVDTLEKGVRQDYKMELIDWQPGGRPSGRPRANELPNRARISYRYASDAPYYSAEEKRRRFLHYRAAATSAASIAMKVHHSKFLEFKAEEGRFQEVIPDSVVARRIQDIAHHFDNLDYDLKRLSADLRALA